MKAKTNEQFIKEGNDIHNFKYDYSLVNYINNNRNVIIICPIHGEFLKSPNGHIHHKKGCSYCSEHKMSKIDFIKKSNKIYKNKYDYSLVNYKNNKTKVKIICPIHGEFIQTPNSHLSKKEGCKDCNKINISKKLSYTINEFIEKANEIHKNKYDYSLVDYKGSNSIIKIICPIHGEFPQIANSHLIGRGCSKCSKNYNYTTLEFIEKSNKIHSNKYDYSLVDYKNIDTNITIICPIHGEFEQIPQHHLNGCRCPECSGVKKYTTESFNKKASIVHNNKYDYSLVNYINNYTKVKIICPIHGEFEANPKHHLNSVGCKLCNESKGEKIIDNFLKKLNIKYKREKTFKDCRSESKSLQFDFYLIDLNICIEYDGIQHFESSEWFGGQESYDKRILYDNIKNNYCKENNINLIRISYKENIEEKLKFLIK